MPDRGRSGPSAPLKNARPGRIFWRRELNCCRLNRGGAAQTPRHPRQSPLFRFADALLSRAPSGASGDWSSPRVKPFVEDWPLHLRTGETSRLFSKSRDAGLRTTSSSARSGMKLPSARMYRARSETVCPNWWRAVLSSTFVPCLALFVIRRSHPSATRWAARAIPPKFASENANLTHQLRRRFASTLLCGFVP